MMTEPRTVLVVEPDAAGPPSPLAASLAGAGWNVSRVDDVAAAFHAARTAPPRIVVARGPIHGGGPLALLRRLRGSAHTALVPVVVAGGSDADRAEFDRWGAQAYLDAGASDEAIAAAVEAQWLAAPPQATRDRQAPADALERPSRLRVLEKTRLLDSPAEATFDCVAQITAHVLDVPVVLMTLVDRHRQFFKAQVGLPDEVAARRETPLTYSFCQWVVSDQGELIVADAREHPLFRTNPATTDLGLVAYAGIPLRSDSIETIGSFCAIDLRPRTWDPQELHALRDAADVIEGLTVLRQHAISPPETWDAFRVMSGVAGQAINAAASLITVHGARLSGAERDALIGVSGDLGRRLTALSVP
jgi:DNA-binding response OmpR family regulator